MANPILDALNVARGHSIPPSLVSDVANVIAERDNLRQELANLQQGVRDLLGARDDVDPLQAIRDHLRHDEAVGRIAERVRLGFESFSVAVQRLADRANLEDEMTAAIVAFGTDLEAARAELTSSVG